MYLYIFEDGEMCQHAEPPTGMDHICMREGILQVLFTQNVSGFYYVDSKGTTQSVLMAKRVNDRLGEFTVPETP